MWKTKRTEVEGKEEDYKLQLSETRKEGKDRIGEVEPPPATDIRKCESQWKTTITNISAGKKEGRQDGKGGFKKQKLEDGGYLGGEGGVMTY